MIRLSDYLKETFGTKLYRLSLQSGCSCPNRDGRLGTGGCTFCSAGGSGEFAAPLLPVRDQIALAKEKVDGKFPKRIAPQDRRYIAYFQSYTNTYGNPVRLEALYRDTISLPEIAVRRLKEAGLTVIVHIIFSLPGESREDMLETVRYLSQMQPRPDGIKIQMLQILKGTQLAREYETDPFPLLSMDQYCSLTAQALAMLPEADRAGLVHR